MWRAIDDPRELSSLSEFELYERVKPLLRWGNLATPERLKRVRDNVRSVCFELAIEWEHSPRLKERDVEFGEYLAARLCATLHELDQRQNPHLYDNHRNYRPERETLPLHEEHVGVQQSAWGTPIVPDIAQTLLEQDLSSIERLQRGLESMHIAVASHSGVHDLLDKFNSGKIPTPYRLAREIGLTPLEARNQPATGLYLELQGLQPATGCASTAYL